MSEQPKHVIKEFKTGYYLIPDHSVPVPKAFECNDTIIDPFCDPRNPRTITFQDVKSAASLIADGVEKTPCPVIKKKSVNEFITIFLTEYPFWFQRSNISDAYGMDLYLKKDCLQYTGR